MEKHGATVSAPDNQLSPGADVENRAFQMTSSTDTSEKPASPSEPSEDKYEYVTGWKLAKVIACVTFVAFLFLLDTSIIGTAIPRITSDFHSLPDVGWYGSAYLLASCALQPSTGKLYTYVSSKHAFLTFLGIFELGSLLCGVANSSKMLIVGRAVAGMGSSGLMNGALTIIAACIPIHKRPIYIGAMLSVSQIGTVLAPLIGGALTQYTTWRWCFYINLPAGGAVAVLLFFTQIPSRHIRIEGGSTFLSLLRKMDLVGFALFAPAAIQCLLALEWGGVQYAWGDAKIIGLFCGSAGTLAVFVGWEYHIGDEAMIPLSMVRQRIVWCSCLVIFFFMGSMLNAAYYLPIYFQAVRGVTPTLSGVYLIPLILSQIIFALLAGYLVGKLGYYLPWIITSGILVSVGTGLFTTFSLTTSTATWVGYEILVGAGRGCGFQMAIIAVQNAVPATQLSVAMSLLVFSQTFGGALFLATADTDFTSSLVKALTTLVPPVNVQAIFNAGATGFREVVSEQSLPGVLMAYNEAVRNTFYLGVGASVAMFVFSWGLGWKSVKKPKAVKPEA